MPACSAPRGWWVGPMEPSQADDVWQLGRARMVHPRRGVAMSKIVNLVLGTALLVAVAGPARSQTVLGRPQIMPLPEEMGRHIGRVQGRIPLRTVVRPEQIPACDALESGRPEEAARRFRAALIQDPQDFAARVGLVQATYNAHMRHIADLVARRGRPGWLVYDRFTLGLLRLYQYSDAEYGRLRRVDLANQPLLTESRLLFKGVFAVAHDPVVALLLCEASYGSSNRVDFDPVFRMLLTSSSYEALAHARKAGWKGPVPETGPMPVAKLAVLERICAFAAAAQSGIDTTYRPVMRDGKVAIVSESRHSPGTDPAAFAWLHRWQMRRKSQLAETPNG